MQNEDWQEVVNALINAKRSLAEAWQILYGTDGTAPGVEPALNAVLSGIDQIYAIESTNEFNQDVASPADVQEFWDRHGELPGFAIGS